MSTAFVEPPHPPPLPEGPRPPHQFATVYAGRRWGRMLAFGVIASVVVHTVPFLLFRSSTIPPSPFGAAGPNAGDVRAAAGGGSGMTMMEVVVRRPPAAEEVPVPIPVPVPEEVVVEPVEVETPPVEEPTLIGAPALPASAGAGTAGAGGGAGADTGPGLAGGTGAGGGGTEEEGRSGMVAPTPRGLILPPSDRPGSVRGREVTVWVFVTDRGRVAPDSTRLDPPTPDAGYNRRLMRSAADWVFEPARRAGRAVAAWYPFQVIL